MRRKMREADFRIDPAFGVEHGRAKLVEAESPAALPPHGLGNAALLALNDLSQARRAMRNGVVAHFDADIATPHLVCDGGGRAGAQKRGEKQGGLGGGGLLKLSGVEVS